jgi:hypothetical protein
MKRSDPKYSYYHTKKRIKERYNINELTESEYKYLCDNCIKYKKINTEITPKGLQETYRMNLEFIEIIVVYQTWKKQVSTVLPYWE